MLTPQHVLIFLWLRRLVVTEYNTLEVFLFDLKG